LPTNPSSEEARGLATAAAATDSVGDILRPGDLQGQYQYHQEPLEQERYYLQLQRALSQSISPPAAIQNVTPYPTDQISQPMNTTDDEEITTTALSQETVLKMEELKRLIYKNPQYHNRIIAA
jgi:hypothetical protein